MRPEVASSVACELVNLTAVAGGAVNSVAEGAENSVVGGTEKSLVVDFAVMRVMGRESEDGAGWVVDDGDDDDDEETRERDGGGRARRRIANSVHWVVRLGCWWRWDREY